MKLWVLLSNALILCGAGHGGAFLVLIEIFFFPFVNENELVLAFRSDGNLLPALAFFTFLGQVAVLLSLLFSNKVVKMFLYILGLVLLLAGLYYLNYAVRYDNHVQLVWFTALPFIFLVITSLGGRFIKRAFVKIYQS